VSGLGDLVGGERPARRILGVVSARVTANNDPDGLGRVRLKYPWLDDQLESGWARLAVPMAGAERGLHLLPEVDDEVLVAFAQGDPNAPYVIGALWNSAAKPPETNTDGKNDRRTLKSRSGHVVRLVDTDGKERIEIADKSGTQRIVLDTATRSVTIEADGDLAITSANGKLTLKGATVEIAADGQLTAKGAQSELRASGPLKVKGATVDIN
jgi:uncharacterized protein involved in type VI secretion and phage assembly